MVPNRNAEVGSHGKGGGLAKIPDALAFLQVSRSKLYSLMEAGDLAYVKLGRNRRIPWSALQDLVNRLSRFESI